MDIADQLTKGQHLFTGRAAAAIYLVLRGNDIRGAQVLVPANLCYAGVLPIILSGNVPVFADVGEDGNLTAQTVAETAAVNLGAAIVPHLYGNPCREIAAINKSLAAREALIIEDCALAMGASVGTAPAGSFGDYAVYSFGYAKTIDCGYGGLIVSGRNLDRLAELNESLEPYEETVMAEAKLFSQLYRVLRNNPEGNFSRYIYQGVAQNLRRCFLFKAQAEHVVRLRRSLARLSSIMEHRRRSAERYSRNLLWNSRMVEYSFHEGAVPWRFNLLVDPTGRSELVEYLLKRQLPVSDWYPVITSMFGVKDRFPQAQEMAARILNFPLVDVSDARIMKITRSINRYWTEHA